MPQIVIAVLNQNRPLIELAITKRMDSEIATSDRNRLCREFLTHLPFGD
jgi:hypothetical protein